MSEKNCRYQNPILYADYSDPDVIRVGDDYYMVASSFCNAPALPVLHSRDLVHWQVVNYVMERLPLPKYDVPCHGQGVWAPSIRHHQGRFYVFFPMPDEGIYMAHTNDPLEKWSDPILVRGGKGWIDPCPLWDDDGKAYLVNAFAKSRCGVKSLLNIAPMHPDGTALISDGKIVFDGHNTQPTIEGPKLYKRNGYYYIFAPAGGVKHGWQTVLRSRDIWGPYEEKIVMMRGGSSINGPHQGGLVDTPGGEWWFVHFQDVGVCGRIVHLQPVCWKNDWPVIGEEKDGEGWGEPVGSWTMPEHRHCITPPVDQHRFGLPSLAWQWNANGRREWIALENEGFSLIAKSFSGKLCDCPNLLLQKFPASAFEVCCSVSVSDLCENTEAGVVMLGKHYGAVVIRAETNKQFSICTLCGEINGEKETLYEIARIDKLENVQLQLCVEGIKCRLVLITGGQTMELMDFCADAGIWVGAKFGLYCIGEGGRIKVDSVVVKV